MLFESIDAVRKNGFETFRTQNHTLTMDTAEMVDSLVSIFKLFLAAGMWAVANFWKFPLSLFSKSEQKYDVIHRCVIVFLSFPLVDKT